MVQIDESYDARAHTEVHNPNATESKGPKTPHLLRSCHHNYHFIELSKTKKTKKPKQNKTNKNSSTVVFLIGGGSSNTDLHFVHICFY